MSLPDKAGRIGSFPEREIVTGLTSCCAVAAEPAIELPSPSTRSTKSTALKRKCKVQMMRLRGGWMCSKPERL